MTSPTQRALADLRSAGFLVHIAERWNPFAKIRQDAFGFADLIAIDKEGSVTFVQVTSAANVAARRDKVAANLAAQRIALGGKSFVEVWGYGKRGPRGKRKTWTAQRWLLVHMGEGLDWLQIDHLEKP